MRNKHDICKPGQRVYAFTPISRVTVRTVNGFTICHERTMSMHDCVQAIAPLFDDLSTRPWRTAMAEWLILSYYIIKLLYYYIIIIIYYYNTIIISYYMCL